MTDNTLNVLSIDTDYVQSPRHFNDIIKFFLNYINDLDVENIVFFSSTRKYILHT